jgi:NIPSNAP protein
MNRRSWLSSMGLSAAGSLAGFSAVTDSRADKRTWVLSLESFRVSHADQMPRLHSYLGRTFLPLLGQVHRGPKMFLEAIVAPHAPQVLFLTAFASFDEMIEVRGKIASHPGIQRACADLESGDAAVEQAQSQILMATHDSLRFDARPTRRETGVFELRSYRAPAWRDRPPATVSAALGRCGIHPIVNASAAAGEHLPRFTYLIPFTGLAARQEAWTRFDADSDWIGLQRDSAGRFGSEAKVTSASIYSLAPYSPLS